jgi:hypothetical protein
MLKLGLVVKVRGPIKKDSIGTRAMGDYWEEILIAL